MKTRKLHEIKFYFMFSDYKFRWVTENSVNGKKWTLKDVYIGPMCPSHCHNNGDCIRGRCRCDSGFSEPACLPTERQRPPPSDRFDHGPPSSSLWDVIDGADVNNGCGSFVPLAHSRHLHFNGCSSRMVTTIPFIIKARW